MKNDTVIRIQYSDESKRDLEQIGDYIAEELKNPGAALKTVNKIQDKIDKLADFPFMGAPLSAIAEVDVDYRILICGKYIAFYRPQGKTILIDRILYGKRDYIAILLRDMELKEEE